MDSYRKNQEKTQKKEQKKKKLQGYLTKQGHVRKNWKTRYFVINGEDVFYYKDSTKNNLKGQFSLRGSVIQETTIISDDKPK